MDKEELKKDLRLILINGSAMFGAFALKKATQAIIEKGFRKKVPNDPQDHSISWGEAIAYAALTGAVAGIVKLYIKHGARKEVKEIVD